MNAKLNMGLLIISMILWACASEPEQNDSSESEQNVKELNYTEVGADIVQSVSSELKIALQSAMKENGPVQAIGVCNQSALALTSSLNDSLKVEVGRTSLKYRNQANQPTALETEVLDGFEKAMKSGETLEPLLITTDEGTHYYAPITMGAFCLTCHGNAEQIAPEVSAQLDSLYPGDLAKGYETGQLRGMWTVKFK